ncbi:mandelate racemase/muconate lactonizing enzyme family protein [Pigmentiphaga soli]|uniref:Mandelate racemase/muconate lactonizing enzyme family protein n=1 Tax=Pigmentiphaga soli TaxID=1007095 RepID=A0ABP8GK67_9BURK
MKITEVKAFALSAPLTGMPRRGMGQPVKKDAVIVRVRTEDGVVGYGHAHDSLNPIAVAELVNANLAPIVQGADAMAVEDIWQAVYRRQGQTHTPGNALYTAQSGVDMALWDVRGKALGMPVYRLLGGSRRKIRAYVGGASFGYKPVQQLVEEAQRYAAQGYTALKLRLGDTVENDVRRLEAVRQAIDPAVDIMVDINTRYDRLQLQRALPALEACKVLWVEEPFPPDAIGDTALFNARTRIPFAAGENHYLRYQARELLETGAVDIIQSDPSKCGGITECKKIADMASAFRRAFAPHNSTSGVVGAACVHLLCAVPHGLFYEADLSPVNPFRDDLAPGAPKVVDGYIEPSELPGLGIEVDESLFDKYPGLSGPSVT